MAARLLQALTTHSGTSGFREALQVQAKQIADNRVYAGVHYPLDSGAGQMLGETLAEYVIARCTQSKQWRSRSFVVPGSSSLDAYDFDPMAETMDKADIPWMALGKDARASKKSEILARLWGAACAEWESAGYTPEK